LQPINVVLVDVTGIVSDIVKGILDEDPGIRVSGEFPLERDTVAHVVGARADVVILATDKRSLPPAMRELLMERRLAKVLTIRDDGRTTSLYELRPHEMDLGQVSPQTLLEAIRSTRTTPL
jgi:DNA-binding NarL/FixJ family response regulator